MEVVPNIASIHQADRHVFVPPLPQRGMVTRDSSRGASIKTVVAKSMTANVPSWLLDPSFAESLGRLGVTLRVETEDDAEHRWPDFSEIDVALCVRTAHPEFDSDAIYLRKPATKLINAWVAGAIPLVAREVAYLELATDGVDAIFIDSPEDVIAAVRSLVDAPQYARRLQVGGAQQAERFSAAATTAAWERTLLDAPRERRVVALHQLRHGLAELASGVSSRIRSINTR